MISDQQCEDAFERLSISMASAGKHAVRTEWYDLSEEERAAFRLWLHEETARLRDV